MQYDPSKQGYNNYPNQYPPQPGMGNNYPNQYPPQPGMGNIYPPNPAPPPYSQYPQQPSGYPAPGAGYPGQTPLYQQQAYGVTPVYRPWNNLVPTPITSSFRTFLIISGIFYLIWGIMALGLEVGIIVNSEWTYYRGIWAGGYLIGSGISMLVVACKPSYVLIHLVRLFAVALVFCILALILSIVNISTSYRCTSSIFWYYCDSTLATNLKIVILVLFIISVVHTIINLVVVNNAQKRALAATATNAPRPS